MPTLILKLMALSGVITAGCFAVWKANAELVPVEAASSSEFTEIGSEPETRGPFARTSAQEIAAASEAESRPVETESVSESADAASSLPVPREEDSPQHTSDEMASADLGALALADHAFAHAAGEGAETETQTVRPQNMPAEFHNAAEEDVEPVIEEDVSSAADVVGHVGEVTSPPEAGVSSREALERQDRANQSRAAQSQPEGRVRLGSATRPAKTYGPGTLRHFPTEAGTPALLPTRNLPQPNLHSDQANRSRETRQGVVQANAEIDDAGEAAFGTVPATGPLEPGHLPADTATDGGPDEYLDNNRAPEVRSSPALRTRTQPGATIGTSQPADNPGGHPFETDPATEGGYSTEPAVTEEFPVNTTTPAGRSRGSGGANDPTPISSFETDGQDTDRPAIPSDEESVDDNSSLQPHIAQPQTGTAFPSSIPRKTITPDMLIGDGVVDDQHLAPSQQPQVRVEKRVQAEADVGVEFIYEIIVQNVGDVTAHQVVVEERIPKGCKMLKSNPVARLGTDRVLRWQLDDLPAGQTKTIKVQVLPLEPGSVGSVATVRFAAEVSSKTIVTAPTLSLSIKHPKEVAIGETVTIKFVITNTGNGIARNATLRALLQPGLEHPEGLDIEQDPWSLAPGQSKEIDLVLTARDAARYTPSVVVVANGVEQENRTLELTVIESRLSLHREGHARRFVNRPAEFVTTVTNQSAEVMKGVVITERLPDGVTPVGEMGKVRWNPKDRTVQWMVSELGPGQYSDLKLTVVSARAGQLAGKIEAVDSVGHRAELPTQLEVEGFTALTLDFQGDGRAVAVGEQVSMRVTVGNKGTAPAKNVQAVFEIPSQMAFVDAKGPGAFQREGNLITFSELDELDANSTQTYDIVLTAAQTGTPTVSVELASAERPQPVRQEEIVTITPAP